MLRKYLPLIPLVVLFSVVALNLLAASKQTPATTYLLGAVIPSGIPSGTPTSTTTSIQETTTTTSQKITTTTTKKSTTTTTIRECITPPTGLVSWWPGEGDATDIVSASDGSLEGGTTFAQGMVEQAFQLDGVDDFVMVSDTPSLNFGTNDFTIDLWVNFTATDGEQVLIEKYAETSGDIPSSGWSLIKLEDNSLRLLGPSGENGGTLLEGTPPSIPTGTWIFVAMVRADDTFTLYWNGDVIGSEILSVDLNSDASFKIGRRGGSENISEFSDTNGLCLNGLIDEVEIFNRALTEEEILDILNAASAGKCKDQITTSISTTISIPTTTTTVIQCPCLAEEIYGENPEEVSLLRNFRDESLTKTASGQELIRIYYQYSPALVKIIEKDETLKENLVRLYYKWGHTVIEVIEENETLREELIILFHQWGPAIIKAVELDEKFREEIKDAIDDI